VCRVLKKVGKRCPRANRITQGKGKKRGGGRTERGDERGDSRAFVCCSLCRFWLRSFELFGRVAELCFIAAGASRFAKKDGEEGVRLG